jgi:hypothetical protein
MQAFFLGKNTMINTGAVSLRLYTQKSIHIIKTLFCSAVVLFVSFFDVHRL